VIGSSDIGSDEDHETKAWIEEKTDIENNSKDSDIRWGICAKLCQFVAKQNG
jgi:hypothetical protein